MTGINATLKATSDSDDLNKKCDQGKDERESQLCAQWKSADQAERSADWAERTFWLGMGGAAIGIATFGAALAAACYAASAAAYTKDGAEQARRSADIAAASLRPRISAYQIVADIDNPKHWQIDRLATDSQCMLWLLNEGDSTAYISKSNIGFFVSQELPARNPIDELWKGCLPLGTVIKPGQGLWWDFQRGKLSAAEVADIGTGARSLFVAGRVILHVSPNRGDPERHILFAKRLNPVKGRFETVTDEDYHLTGWPH